MKMVAAMCLSAMLGGLMAPASVHAADLFSLDFLGTASPNFTGDLTAWQISSFPQAQVSFAGQPVRISLTVSDDVSGLYVSRFDVSWSDQAYAFPYITHDGHAGVPDIPQNDDLVTYLSIVDLTSTGGAIRVFPSFGFRGALDGGTDLNFSYTLSQPHDFQRSFREDGLNGGGSIDSSVNNNFDPRVGPFDALSHGDFTVSSLRVNVFGVPELSTWTLMILGFGAVGAMLRREAASTVA